ncbi:hypothetical protein D3C72_2078540 [compost metagenome]
MPSLTVKTEAPVNLKLLLVAAVPSAQAPELVPENSHSKETLSPLAIGSPFMVQTASGAALRKLSMTPVLAASFPLTGLPTDAS